MTLSSFLGWWGLYPIAYYLLPIRKDNFIWQPLIGLLQCLLNPLCICCTVARKVLENCSVKPHAAWMVFLVSLVVWSGEINLLQCPLGPEFMRIVYILILKTKLCS